MNNLRWTILAALLVTTTGVARAQSPSPSASPMPLSSSSSSMSSSSSSMSSSSGTTGSTAASTGGVADSGAVNSVFIDPDTPLADKSGATPGIPNDAPTQDLDGSVSSTTVTTTVVHSVSKSRAPRSSAKAALVNTGGEPLLVTLVGLSMAASALVVRRRISD